MEDLIFEGRMPISEDQTCALNMLYQDGARDMAITGQDATEALRVEFEVMVPNLTPGESGGTRQKRHSKINTIGEIHPMEEGASVG